MPQQHLRFEPFFAAPRPQVFAYFADHARFGRLWPGRTRRVRAGDDPAQPDGLGSVREIRMWPARFEETVTAFVPDELIEYRLTRGGALRNHRGRLQFESVPGGTKLVYDIEFDSRLPLIGGLVARFLYTSFRRGIYRVIEEITGVPPPKARACD